MTPARNWQMDRILIILKKENGPRASSAPALGLNTIIFKHVYWYMQQTQVSVYRTIGPLVLHISGVNIRGYSLHGHVFLMLSTDGNNFKITDKPQLSLSVERPHEKTNNLHMRNQRRRSASRKPRS